MRLLRSVLFLGTTKLRVAVRPFAAKRDQTKHIKAGDEAKVGATMPEHIISARRP